MAARFVRFRQHGVTPLAREHMPDREYEEWAATRAWSPGPASGLVIDRDLAAAAWIEPLLRARSSEVRRSPEWSAQRVPETPA
jgi:hypothetical protein